ncbi:MAG: DUF6531 domain-containing protein, partial [Butyrivibrio sp.]|nr:DUF6531 domain-containing protein [Butyrivibrio sp.]
MELAYQSLLIRLPFEGAIGVEAFEMRAAFNDHVSLMLLLLMEEEKIETLVHGVEDGDHIEVYKEENGEVLYAGKITDAKMEQQHGLCLLRLRALSYTMEWSLAPISQSFLNLNATYKQVMDKVLENQEDAEILDCVTQGSVIPDFLLQYEESDWDFLVRLASHFHTFLIPDCHAVHGRAYFGIPDLGDEYVLSEDEFTEIKDMDEYYRMGRWQEILSQETLRWKVATRHDFCLAQRVCFRGISAIVTEIRYQTVDGELVRTYELSREKGVLCAPKKNPNIFGMSIPATVMERSGNCVRVHFHIDPEYDNSPNVKYFTYAIESSFIYCMPEEGSQVHIYFPGDDEKDAIAVHAIRTSGESSSGYAQIPDNKSFSNTNGAEMLMTPSCASVSADPEKQTCVYLDTDGNALITGKTINLYAEKNLLVGEPMEEDGQSSKQLVLEAKALTLQIGENGSQIDLAEESRIISTFVKLDASDRSPAENPSLDELKNAVTATDADNRNRTNEDVSNKLQDKFEEGRTSILKGILKVATTVATIAVGVALTVATGGAAAVIIGTIVLGAATAAFAVADVGEGIDNYEKSQNGDLSRGYNFMRDGVFGGNELLYGLVRAAVEIAFGIVAGKAIGGSINKMKDIKELASLAEKAKKLKPVMQIGGDVLDGAFDDLARTGTINPVRVLANVTIGIAQGSSGTGIRDGMLKMLGIEGCSFSSHMAKAFLGGTIDTIIDGIGCRLSGQDFDLQSSFLRNLFINGLDAFISDPVDAVTGIYCIEATDFILSSLPVALQLDRSYYSTGTKDSVMGVGWRFPYASRIYRDTKDTEHLRVHLETITGHSVCYEEQDGIWVNRSKGASRFLLEVQEQAGAPGQELYLLTDVEEHTLCVYDGQGLLQYVEYPGRQRLAFSYDGEGLERITTPLGNVLEVECHGGRILQITDEIGRRTQYRYEGNYLVDVVHTDEGITHYEYDENGHITSVTDQNGSRFLENEYDAGGRVVRQNFSSGVYQTFTYDDVNRRNVVYYSESGKTETYEFNDRLLKERVIYDDGTCETYCYSDDNLKTGEISRMGHRREWEYDLYGRTVREKSPDGYEVRHEYDDNHDLVRTWDTDGRETRYVYDDAHNPILIREKLDNHKWRETAREYDSMGRCIVEQDALGNETRKEYDSNHAYPGRVITPKGEETVYGYDAVGRRMSISNSYGTVE